ncbi:MAG: S8 family serine peptidase, partial [Methanobacteriota archaeon]
NRQASAFAVVSLIVLLVPSVVVVPTAVATPPAGSAPGALPPMSPGLARALVAPATGEIEAIVRLAEPVAEADLQRALDHGLAVSLPLRSFPIFGTLGTPAATRAFLRSGGIEYAEVNEVLTYSMASARISTLVDSVSGNLPGIGGPLTIAGTVVDGTGVGIAIVDAGIDTTHPDLPWGSKVVKNWQFVCPTYGLIHTGTGRCYLSSLLKTNVPATPDVDGCNELVADPSARYAPTFWVDAPTTDHSSGHGTHVAGIAAGSGAGAGGRFRGAAPGASLYGFGVGEGINILAALEAFDWIVCNADLVSPPIRVVNNSWGTAPALSGCGTGFATDASVGGSQELLVNRMITMGITVVFSAGNAGGDGSLLCTSPQSRIPTPGVVSVANFDDQERGTRDAPLDASSSRGRLANKATWPDVAAPGTWITSAKSKFGVAATTLFPDPRDPAHYVFISGTSMAAPHTAGVIALMRQANPSLTPAQIEDILEDSAHKFNFVGGGAYSSDPANADDDTSFDKGHGLVDARAAVLAAAALAGTVLGDTPPTLPYTGGEVLYLRTAPTGLGNVDNHYEGFSNVAPTKVEPSSWHDPEPLTNADPFWVSALYAPGNVQLVGTPVTLRFWTSPSAAVFVGTPNTWTARLSIGGTVVTRTLTGTIGATAPKQYDVDFGLITASGTGIKLVLDSAQANTNFANEVLYDSVLFPTSLSVGGGANPDGASALPTVPAAEQACNFDIVPPECFESIQDAIDASAPGHTVLVGPGTFEESVEIDKAVRVVAAAGNRATTILAPVGSTSAVLLSGSGAELSNFLVSHSSPIPALVSVTGSGTTVGSNRFTSATAGAGVHIEGSGSATLTGNSFATPVGVLLDGSGGSYVQSNVFARTTLGGTAILVSSGPGASISGNDFSGYAVHYDDTSDTGFPAHLVFASNTFDRAVAAYQPGDPLNETIYGTVQGAVNGLSAPVAGSTLFVRPGSYREAVFLGPANAGLEMCSTTDYYDVATATFVCEDLPRTTIIDSTGVAPVALTVPADFVSVHGFTIRVNSEPATAVDASGEGFVFYHNIVETGTAGTANLVGGSLPSTFSPMPLTEYLQHPFVAATFGTSALAAIRERHDGEPGFLSALPLAVEDAHVALLYSGSAPASVKAALAASGGVEDGLPVRVQEDVETRTLKETVSPEELAQSPVVSSGPEGPMLPENPTGIGPGTHLIFQYPGIPAWRCTANFLFKDVGGTYYLGTAGHCVLPDGMDSTLDPSYQQPYIQACVESCLGAGLVRINNVLFNLTAAGASVLYGQQAPDPDNNPTFGDDYAWITLPASVTPMLRAYEPFWGGPTGIEDPSLGSPLVHYGKGLLVGEFFVTEGRAGISDGSFSDGSYEAVGWVTGGDSGSGALTADFRGNEMLLGDKAAGDITHSIVVIGAPLFLGTRVSAALGFLEAATGVELSLVLEDEFPIESTPETIGIDLSGSVSALVAENSIIGGVGQFTGGTGVLAVGGSSPSLLENEIRGWTSSAVALVGTPSSSVADNLIADGCTGVRLADTAQPSLSRNTLSTLVCDGVRFEGESGGAALVGSDLFMNSFLATPVAIRLREVDGVAIDATYNRWHLPTRTAIRALIVDESRTDANAVDVDCFIDIDDETPICPPTPDFSFDPATPIWRHEVDFTDESEPGGRPITSWSWDFGEPNATSDEQDPSHTFMLPGSYSVTLTVTDLEGYSASVTQTVTVVNNAPVLAPIGDRSVNESQILSFAVTATDADGDAVTRSVSGLPAGATFNAATGAFQWVPTYAQAGTYPAVTFYATDGNLTDSETITITVVDQPQPPVAGISGPRYVRPGVAATWTSPSYDVDGPLAYQNWTATDGFLGSGASVTHAFALQGTYTLDLLVT